MLCEHLYRKELNCLVFDWRSIQAPFFQRTLISSFSLIRRAWRGGGGFSSALSFRYTRQASHGAHNVCQSRRAVCVHHSFLLIRLVAIKLIRWVFQKKQNTCHQEGTDMFSGWTKECERESVQGAHRVTTLASTWWDCPNRGLAASNHLAVVSVVINITIARLTHIRLLHHNLLSHVFSIVGSIWLRQSSYDGEANRTFFGI